MAWGVSGANGMTEQTGLRKLLVLDGPGLDSAGILGPLGSYFEVHIAHELDEALAAMREGRFDAVLAETGDFLPLERGIVMQHASVVLEEIGDGEELIRALLLGVGAAMGANCERCLNKAVPALLEAGAMEEDIRKAVEIGQLVKDEATAFVRATTAALCS